MIHVLKNKPLLPRRVLVERYGFQTTFLITACLKLGAFLPLTFLLRYVRDGWLAGARAGPGAGTEGYVMLPENATAAGSWGTCRGILLDAHICLQLLRRPGTATFASCLPCLPGSGCNAYLSNPLGLRRNAASMQAAMQAPVVSDVDF